MPLKKIRKKFGELNHLSAKVLHAWPVMALMQEFSIMVINNYFCGEITLVSFGPKPRVYW